MCEIERALRGTNVPHVKYNKSKVEGYKLEIQQILRILNASFDENLARMGERPRHFAPFGPHDTATTSVPESGTSPVPPSPAHYGMLIVPDRSSRLQHFSLRAFDQTRFRSARTPLPD